MKNMAKKNIQSKIKEPVRLRSKKLANGSESLYLDIYLNGKRSYEFLKLYVHPETDPQIKVLNNETMKVANAIKMERILEITRNEAGLKHTSSRSKMLLKDWMQTYYADQERKGVRCLKLLRSTMRVLDEYNGKATMREVDRSFCTGFIDFLQHGYKTRWGKKLTPKSASDYAGTLNSALNAAVRAEVIGENPFMQLAPNEKIQVPESKREFLTVDELKSLIATGCHREDVKRAYLFACFCGLRFGDVAGMKWGDITQDGDQWRVTVIMQKTGRPIYQPLSESAMQWLPERGDASPDDAVFRTLPALASINRILKIWAEAAGVTKRVSFHTSRHTFATMLLTLGADLYTVCKLLGHSNVKTTQIYAKIVDSKKVEAVNLFDKAFG